MDVVHYPEGGLMLTTVNGQWEVVLPPHRAVRPEWQTGWERERLDSMHRELSRLDRPVVFDVGTEEGDLSVLYATWGCRVVLVEPNPRVWPNVRWCFDHNMEKPLGWWNGFAGPKTIIPDGHIGEPYSGEDWPAAAYGELIGDHGFLNLSERPDVPVTTLDHLSDLVGEAPAAITMDIEGAELAAMRGAGGILDHHRPLVWISVHPQFSIDMYAATREDLLVFMAGHGYQSELLAVDHEQHFLFRPLP